MSVFVVRSERKTFNNEAPPYIVRYRAPAVGISRASPYTI